jgi:branched-chain amino acid transport system permease protein
MEYFLLTLVTGFCSGCTFGLVGLAFTAIFNASKIINFANGDLAVVGAFASALFVFSRKVHPIAGVVGILIMSVAAGVFLYLLTEPTVRKKAPVINSILVTMGGGLITSGLIGIQTKFLYFQTGFIFGSKPFVLGPLRLSPQYILIVLTTAVLTFSYWLVLNKTYLGMGLKALGINPDMANLVGINDRLGRALTWGISSGISGIAGFVLAPLTLPSALMGMPLVINGFIAAVIGGFGYPLAAVTGGLALGLFVQFFTAYISPGFAQLVMFLVLIIVLIFRPTGIWGLKLQA